MTPARERELRRSRPLPTDITDSEIAYLRNLMWQTIRQAPSAEGAMPTALAWADWERRIREGPRVERRI